MGIFNKLKKTLRSGFGGEKLEESLSKTRRGFIDKVVDFFTGREIDDDFYDELEEILIQGDVGVNTSITLVENIRKKADKDKIKTAIDLKEIFVNEIAELMGTEKNSLNLVDNQLNIILVVGVNGAGKTTSIGKLTYKLKNEGKKVLLVAGDTFRAAAIDQLKIWGDRNSVEVVAHQEGADPGAVVYDGIQAAIARKSDVLIVDTAGRLQNKVNLMEELKKIKRIIDRESEGSLSEVLLVLDATTGQNALTQAKMFKETAEVTGVILSKLDGTAKGGIVIGIKSELDLPVKLIGTGEKIEDLQDFNPESFVGALFSGMESEEDE